MTSTSVPSLQESEQNPPYITQSGWLWILSIGALFITLFWGFIFRMARIANPYGDFNGDWTYILIIPLFSIYFIFLNRSKLFAVKRKTFWPGLVLIYMGIAGYAFGIYPGRNDMAQGYSMIMCLFGLVLFTLGPAMTKVLWFPIAYLFFGVKVSQAIWDAIAWRLQNVAATSSTYLLEFLGYDVFRRGTTIELTFVRNGVTITEGVNVEEACSGLRMLMAFVALGVAIAYLSDRKWWQRLIMLLSTVPVAIAVNVGRVTAIGIIHTINPEYARGDFHIFVGMLMLIPAGLIFLLIGWILDQIVLDDSKKSRTSEELAASRKVSREDSDSDTQSNVKGAILGGSLTLGISGLVTSIFYFINPQTFDTSSRFLPAVLVFVSLAVLIVAVVALRRFAAGIRFQPKLSKQTTMAVALGIMLVSVLGLQGVVWATKTVLHKKEVPLRHELYTVSKYVGNWEMEEELPPLTEEILQAVGTNQYLQRIYRDTSMLKGMPGSIMRLHVFYYTGTADTVPHVPDRCYVAGGLKPHGDGIETIYLPMRGVRYREVDGQWWADTPLNFQSVRIPSVDIPATIFTYSQQAANGKDEQVGNVVYFFAANGKFLSSPNYVRAEGFKPTDEYSYYCKIEILPVGIEDPQQAQERVASFLSTMLPDIMACLPDWVDVREGRWPVKQDSTNHLQMDKE